VTISLLDSLAASRFFTRWTHAKASRPALLAECAQLSLNLPVFQRLLQDDIQNNTTTTGGNILNGAMRRLRNLVVCTLIERDLHGQADLNEVVQTMTAFADFAVQTHLQALMQELTALHGMPVGAESGEKQELIVLGMGKLGGGELNVSSDIDLIFVYPENGETRIDMPGQRQLSNHEFFVRLGKKLIGALSEVTEDGFTFRVDMALRPNGASGPLVASMNMVEEYLIRQGREWERYAWTKARALTGRPDDIAALESISRPFIYRRYLDFGSIDALRSMHAQIRAEVKRQEVLHPERSNNVKLGRGGIREVEFISQVFQLIRGGRDPELRDRSTRTTLRTLSDKNLLAPEVVTQLLAAYTFLRNLEHRLQYLDDAQTHVMPPRPEDQLRVAQMMGYADVAALQTELDRHRGIVAQQFDAIFNDKQSNDSNDSTGNQAASGKEATPLILHDGDNLESICATLTGLGFEDATGASQLLLLTLQSSRLQALPDTSRTRLLALLNAALAVIVAMPEAATRIPTLRRLLDFFEAIARRAAYLALLTEFPQALTRLIRMMAASDWAAKYLTQHPLLLDELLDDRHLKMAPDWSAFALDCQRQLDTATGDTERQMDILREVHHAQLFRLLAQDLEGELSVERLADHLSALADILVATALQAIWQGLPQRHRDTPQFTIIAYGKLGGRELGYVSDLDLVFLYDDDAPDAPALYAKLAQRFITWMTAHTPAGTLFDIDIALRPDGASGLLVSSLTAFEKYQRNSAWMWEHQALTRARFCAGDSRIGNRFETLREDLLRQPREPQKLRQEVLGMRLKMHQAYPNRGTLFDLKHDDGGMIDIEFIVQFLVLRHAAQYTQLTGDIGNIALLKLCSTLGLIDPVLADQVAAAYRLFRKLQHQIRLQGEERARTPLAQVQKESDSVKQLWAEVFS
jgi:[glutamine synthetase] adenylyltransferase / [glutamine synthetase]-adenylyl-L-tyrosine phosphorylase